MIFRNIKSGAEIVTNSLIVSPNWIRVDDNKVSVAIPEEAPIVEPPKEETVTEEPKAPKKSAPKKRTRK